MFDIEGPLSGAVSCLSIEAPVETWYRRQVMAALALMTNEQNWNNQPGVVDPADVVDVVSAASSALGSYASECEGGSVIGIIGSFVLMPEAVTPLPDGLLLCDGSNMARVDYPDLYQWFVDTQYPLIVDADNATLPDLSAITVTWQGLGPIDMEWAIIAR